MIPKILIWIVSLFSITAMAQCKSGIISENNKEFSKTISNKTVQIVDVRTPQEFADGHIPGAVNIDVNSDGFKSEIQKLDKTQPVAVYCRSGRRSKMAGNLLVKEGFTVHELDNGFSEWDGESVK